MLISTPLIKVRTDLQCDSCKSGIMLPIFSKQNRLEVVGGKKKPIQHKCTTCDNKLESNKRYPLYEYVEFFDFLKLSQQILKGNQSDNNPTD